MPKMQFRGARVRYFDGRLNDEGGHFTRIHLAADFSDPVREAMEWGEVQEGAKESKLEGSLNATNLILTPNGKDPNGKALKEHELKLSAQEVHDFKFVRGKTAKDGTVKEDRLDFVVVSAEQGAAAKVEEYVRAIGKGVGSLGIGYTEQEEMDLGEADEKDDKQDRLISDEQAEDTTKEDGDESNEGQSLASAATAGGTHQRKKKVVQ